MNKCVTFQDELRALINRHSLENYSNTPDYLLAAFLSDCLEAFDTTVNARERWYGRTPKPVGTAALNTKGTE